MDTFIAVGGFVLTLIVMLGNFMHSRGKQEALEETLTGNINNLRGQVDKQWNWKDEHEKESSDIRFEFQKQIGRIEALAAVRDSQYSQILAVMSSMEKNLQGQIERIQKELTDLHLHGRSSD